MAKLSSLTIVNLINLFFTCSLLRFEKGHFFCKCVLFEIDSLKFEYMLIWECTYISILPGHPGATTKKIGGKLVFKSTRAFSLQVKRGKQFLAILLLEYIHFTYPSNNFRYPLKYFYRNANSLASMCTCFVLISRHSS